MVIKQKCLECGETFEIAEEEQNWYKEKDYKLPKRCKSCRSLRRKRVIGREDYSYGQKKN